MRLMVVYEEGYCLKDALHSSYCTGVNRVCYRCGMLLGPCDCPELGSPFDY